MTNGLTRLTVFISSTVNDFKPVRRDLREWLEARQIVVHQSEEPSFPVGLGMHSHEACLQVIAGCHLVILLVGNRYGGRFAGTEQSITWREYAEARRLRIPVITVILKETNDQAILYAQSTDKPQFLLKAPKDFDLIVKFVQDLRKGEIDNWAHLEWDGSFAGLRTIVDARINALFVHYKFPTDKLMRSEERLQMYATACAELNALLFTYRISVSSDVSSTVEKKQKWMERIIDTCVRYLSAMFGFADGDERYNIAIYKLEDNDILGVATRRCHKDIPRNDRKWPLGVGHVGLAAKAIETYVARNLRFTEDDPSVNGLPTDQENYVSIIATPIRKISDSGRVAGVLVISSDRPDRFCTATQAEVRTAESLASLLANAELP
jgi:hypothetical protein